MDFQSEEFKESISKVRDDLNTELKHLETLDFCKAYSDAKPMNSLQNGAEDSDEEEQEAVDSEGLTETERVLLSLKLYEEEEGDAEEKERKVEEKPSKFEKKSGQTMGKPRFNKQFKNHRNKRKGRGGRGRGGGGGRGRGGKRR